MAEIREPPTFEEFMKMSWTEKHRVKEKYPAEYWNFIEQIRNQNKEN